MREKDWSFIMTENSNTRTAILVAVIGLVGVLASALIANWDKIFSRQSGSASSSNSSTPNAGSAPQATPTRSDANNSPILFNGIRFFEGTASTVPRPDQRLYRDTFNATDTKYVYYEVSITSHDPTQRIDLTITKTFFNASGIAYCQNSFRTDIGPNETTEAFYGGCASPDRRWERGKYKVVVSVNGKEIIGSFVMQ
jgi:hypothetical protein